MALACLLTLLVFAIALVIPQEQSVIRQSFVDRTVSLGGMWLGAIWNPGFLTFALQMCLVLLTGFGLAKAPLSQRVLRRIASIPNTNRGAVMLIAAVSCIGCWINWGFGLILAGVLASELRRQFKDRGVGCQYALIVAAAYAGMMIWHGGLSGSAPLKVASERMSIIVGTGDDKMTAEVAPITIDRTLLGSRNLLLTAGLFVAIPFFFGLLAHPRGMEADDVDATDESVPKEPPSSGTRDRTFSQVINESPVLPCLIGGLVFLGLYQQVAKSHSANANAGWWLAIARSINLNFVNSMFLAMGLVLHGNLMSYLRAVASGGTAIVGIVIQFPLYSGIQGLMSGAGLAAAISNGFVESSQIVAGLLGISVDNTFPIATLASAGIVNFFVPSGGGQWIVQGPIMCGAAQELGFSIERTVMAIAYGDQLTNMVQPFWAIPLMGMTNVNAREFMGYCALLMLVSIPIFALAVVL